MNNKNIIPVFYACDETYLKYALVSIYSLIKNMGSDCRLDIHILNTGISEETMRPIKRLAGENVSIQFDDVTRKIKEIESQLPLRDYYSMTTYYRIFIAQMFPWYDKVIYIDSDTIVQGDISKMYEIELGDNYVGGVNDPVVSQTEIFADYVEQTLGIDRYDYFNAGVLLINIKAFREEDVLGQFVELINKYSFIVAQDQDYLNVICQGRVKKIDPSWDSEVYGTFLCPVEQMNIIHYNLAAKPWHYKDCRLADIFWQYASETEMYAELERECGEYTDEQRLIDEKAGENLAKLAAAELAKPDNYYNTYVKNRLVV
jgi:lipopolysaccharide biosynthesis glycosyltransferase